MIDALWYLWSRLVCRLRGHVPYETVVYQGCYVCGRCWEFFPAPAGTPESLDAVRDFVNQHLGAGRWEENDGGS